MDELPCQGLPLHPPVSRAEPVPGKLLLNECASKEPIFPALVLGVPGCAPSSINLIDPNVEKGNPWMLQSLLVLDPHYQLLEKHL